MSFQQIKNDDFNYVMQSYGRYPVAFCKGAGVKLWDVDGKEYLDLSSGIGVNCLGYSDPDWQAAICGQTAQLGHISNYFYNPVSTAACKRLAVLSGLNGRVFMANSGAEANEGAIKIARKYSFDKYGPGRSDIITLENSFHGRTITTLAATGQEAFHNYFYQFTEGFRYVPAGDIAPVCEQIETGGVCAVMLELVQGEGGVIPLDKEYIKQLGQLCKQNDVLLIIDEVQTGVGRTGTLFAYEQFDIRPDIVSVSKGIAGGLPLGCVIAAASTKDVLQPGQHATTFGGNPICCAAALCVLDKVSNPTFLQNVRDNSKFFMEGLSKIRGLTEVRGLGFMIAANMEKLDAKAVVTRLLENGIVGLTAKTSLRFLPPLVITKEDLTFALKVIEKTLKDMYNESSD